MLMIVQDGSTSSIDSDRTNNATIEVIIEAAGFNNSLAGDLNCPNTAKADYKSPVEAWVEIYLQNGMLLALIRQPGTETDFIIAATSRFNNMTDGFKWTLADVYAAQKMCPLETVAYGFSRFCDLFTYEEWQSFSYSIDLSFSSGAAFHSATGVSYLPANVCGANYVVAGRWPGLPTRGYCTPQESHTRLLWLSDQYDTRRHEGDLPLESELLL